MSDLIIRQEAIKTIKKTMGNKPLPPSELYIYFECIGAIKSLPSAEAVPIHEDGTLEVKVPNAQKVGRVLVMDTDSHIGGGLFYPESAEAVEVVRCKDCKWFGDIGCAIRIVDDSDKPTENDFCSFGERKGGDDE